MLTASQLIYCFLQRCFVECGSKPADIVFVLDESGSIWGPHFDLQLKFVKGVSDYMDISVDDTRIAVETFSDDYRSGISNQSNQLIYIYVLNTS